MPKLVVDNREVEVEDGATILDAANKLGVEIPTMCYLKGYKPTTSCMLCVVKIVSLGEAEPRQSYGKAFALTRREGLSGFVPACGTIAKDGMRVETNSQEIRTARQTVLELLLSDHLGDCMGPCQAACPAGMNIPLMIRQIAAGNFRDAIATVKKDIALPAVLGRICPAPCEKACRRANFDEAVSICLLKRFVADVDLESVNPYVPTCKPNQDKKVAIIGAGPAGLAAAYYLLQDGFNCTIFDEREEPGGMLRYAVPQEQLPRVILDREIAIIEKLGAEFRKQTRVGTDISMEELRKEFDAIFVAVGQVEPDVVASLGLKTGPNGVVIDRETYETNLHGVFAGGDAVRKRQWTVRAVADGKEAVISIAQYLSGQRLTGPIKPFNTRIGKLQDGEIEKFMAGVSRVSRLSPVEKGGGFTEEQARQEAARCLHCDCRKAESCKLRQYAQQYNARPGKYKAERRLFVQQVQHPDIIYEPGKCIDCGLCIQIASEAGEELGLTFIGRGFNVRVTVPFGYSIAEGLTHMASQCVQACPTGALAFKDKHDSFSLGKAEP